MDWIGHQRRSRVGQAARETDNMPTCSTCQSASCCSFGSCVRESRGARVLLAGYGWAVRPQALRSTRSVGTSDGDIVEPRLRFQ